MVERIGLGSQPLPQNTIQAQQFYSIHGVPATRANVQKQRRIDRAITWVCLSILSGLILIAMILSILPLVISPSGSPETYILELNNSGVNTNSFTNDSSVTIPNFVRLGINGLCSSASHKFKDRECQSYSGSVHWNNITEIFASLVGSSSSDVSIPTALFSNHTSTLQTSIGTSLLGEAIGSPIIHGIAFLFSIPAIVFLGIRAKLDFSIGCSFIVMTLIFTSMILSTFPLLGDVDGFFRLLKGGFSAKPDFGIIVGYNWGFRVPLYIVALLDAGTICLSGVVMSYIERL